MLKKRLLLTIIGVLASLTLLPGAWFSHAFAMTSLTSRMNQQMTQNQCQSSCNFQTNYFVPGQQIGTENKDLEPQPVEPYSMMLMVTSWPAVALIGAYLLWHLRWKPPDIFSLYAYYRI